MRTSTMGRPRRNLAAIACSLMSCAGAAAAVAHVPGGCNVPASERTSDVGCYLAATEALASMRAGPVYWHLYAYPTRAAAEAAKGPGGTVVESFERTWLFTIADERWRPSGGERVAVLGPFSIAPGRHYTARYMEAMFTAGMRAAIHRHSGPEAFYLISGAQCLETPEGITVTHAGEGAIVPEGPPMALSSVGTETRRSLVFVLHDSSKPWITMAEDWQPKGLCP
jgi:quercetin dioxygenase-like cupin family protein